MSDILKNILETRQRVDDSLNEFNKSVNPITWFTNHFAQKSINNRYAGGNYQGGIVRDGKHGVSTWESLFGATSADAEKAFRKSVDTARSKADPYLFPETTDGKSADEISRDVDNLRRQRAVLTANKVGESDLGIQPGQLVPSGELLEKARAANARIKDDNQRRQINLDLGKEYAPYGITPTVGTPRVTDDGAPVVGTPERGSARQEQRSGLTPIEQKAEIDRRIERDNTIAQKGLVYGEDAVEAALQPNGGGLIGLQHDAAINLLERENDTNFASKQSRYERHRDQESDRRSDYRFNIKRADDIAAQRAEIDLAKLKMQHEVDLVNRQHEFDMQHYQQGMIGNLLGGLFSLGSLL